MELALPLHGKRMLLPSWLLGNVWARELVRMAVNSLARVEEVGKECRSCQVSRPCLGEAHGLKKGQVEWGCQRLWGQSLFCRSTDEDKVDPGLREIGLLTKCVWVGGQSDLSTELM